MESWTQLVDRHRLAVKVPRHPAIVAATVILWVGQTPDVLPHVDSFID